jgi:hypothetical protein
MASRREMQQVASYVRESLDPEGETVTVRPSATAILAIDSDDRYPDYLVRRTKPTYPFSINIQKKENILTGYFKRLALTEFRLNWTLPNISSVWGNNLMFMYWTTDFGVTVTVTTISIPDEFYGAEELAAEIQKQIRSAIPQFIVRIKRDSDDVMTFIGPAPVRFFFTSTGSSERELVDVLNIPTVENPPITTPMPDTLFNFQLNTGVPNLRCMDYIDIVCSQLSYNQELKDASSAAITRDMLARIYLDDSVGSSSLVTTNYFTFTPTVTNITAIPALTVDDEVTYTVTSTTGYTVGSVATIAGITGGVGWNAQATIVRVISGTSIQVVYDDKPTGTPTSVAGATFSASAFTQTSTPATTWDDRVNGVTPFVIYRQFATPKQIRWNNKMPIGNLKFEIFDDQGRSIQDLWNRVYPSNTPAGLVYANSFVWNATFLVSED